MDNWWERFEFDPVEEQRKDDEEKQETKKAEADNNDKQDEEQEEEEAAPMRVRKAPNEPTKREREEHEATHIPYRS